MSSKVTLTIPAQPDRSSVIEARLLGAFDLQCNGQSISLPPSAKARALLAYLLLHRQRPCPRSVLVGSLWPETPDRQALRLLSNALWLVQKTLPNVIEADPHVICVAPRASLWVDVESFITLTGSWLADDALGEAARRDLRQAVDLYGGDLLPGLYDEWVMEERSYLQETYHRALEHLIHLEKRACHYEQALNIALRLSRSDPLLESVQREIMRLHMALNRPQEALRQFNLYCQVIQREVGAAPEPATQELAHAIAEIARRANLDVSAYLPHRAAHTEDMPPLAQKDPGRLPIIGRDQERDQILTLLEGILANIGSAGNLALVEGEAGVGKTCLAQRVAQDAEWRGASVLWCKGRPAELAKPYALFAELLASGLSALRAKELAQIVAPVWLQVLAQMLPDLKSWLPGWGAPPPLEPAHEQERLVEAFAQALLGWAQITPLLLILEDLHWADHDSLILVPKLIKRVRGARLLMAVTYRGAEVRQRPEAWDCLQSLDRVSPPLHVRLENLTQAAASELIRVSLGLRQPVPHFEARLYHETQGNPLFLLQTLHLLSERGLLYRDANGDWATPFDETTLDYGELLLPLAIEQSIVWRLQHLPTIARQVLNAAAVIDAEIDLGLLQSITSIDHPALLATVSGLGHWRFLEETPKGYRLCHDKLGQVVYDNIDTAERLQLHRRVAEALEVQDPAPVEAIAHHYIQGQMWSKAAVYAFQTANQVKSAYANEAAIAAYRQTLEVLDWMGQEANSLVQAQQIEARQAMAEVLALVGRYGEALAQLGIALSLLESEPLAAGRPWQLANLHYQLACAQEGRGEYALAIEQLEKGLSYLAKDEPTPEAARLYYLWGLIHTQQGHYAPAQAMLERALSQAQAACLRQVEADSWRAIGLASHYQSHYSYAETCYQQARSLYVEIGNRQGEGRALGNLGDVCAQRGEARRAIDLYEQALVIARQIGNRRREGFVLSNLGVVYANLGELDQAILAHEQALVIAREIDNRLSEGQALCNLGDAHAKLGELRRAITFHEQALALMREAGNRRYECAIVCNLGGIYADSGEPHHAIEFLEQALAMAREMGDRRAEGYVLTSLGHALADLGQLPQAAQAYQQAVDLRRSLGVQALTVESLAGLAQTRLAEGKVAEAAATVEDVLSYLEEHALQGVEDPYHIYLACYNVLKASHDPRAENLLETAYAFLQEQAAKIADPAARRLFLGGARSRRELAQAYEQRPMTQDVKQITVWLPAAVAPARGPLPDKQKVEVTWTVRAFQDEAITGKATRRRQRVLRLLREAEEQGAAPTVQALSDALGVSVITITRDLVALRRAGHRARTRGSK